jgi:hypothetical protein
VCSTLEDLYGRIELKGHDEESGSNCVFVDGPLWVALRDGGAFVADELNLLSNEVLVAIRQIFGAPLSKEPALLTNPINSAKAYVHPNFVLIGTQNDKSVAGRKTLPLDVLLRCLQIKVPKYNPESIRKILESKIAADMRTPNSDREAFSVTRRKDVKYLCELASYDGISVGGRDKDSTAATTNEEDDEVQSAWHRLTLRDRIRLIHRVCKDEDPLGHFAMHAFVLFHQKFADTPRTLSDGKLRPEIVKCEDSHGNLMPALSVLLRM